MRVVPALDKPMPKTVRKKTILNAMDGASISAAPNLPRKKASVRLYTASMALPSIMGRAMASKALKTPDLGMV